MNNSVVIYRSMPPEAQRIAIAEARGLHFDLVRDGQLYIDSSEWGSPDQTFTQLADPLADLNAMHEAYEKGLNSEQKSKWAGEIYNIVDRDSSNGEISMSIVCDPRDVLGICANATAIQRAEAFLRTINKWTDDDVTK